MPGLKEPADLSSVYAEIERLLFKSHDVVLRSSMRVSEAHRTLNETDRANAQFRTELNECRRMLDRPRSS